MREILTKDYDIFKHIIDSTEYVYNKWELLDFEEGDIICKCNEVYKYFYVIIKGNANIYHTCEKGKTYSQSIYGAGDYFGELEIFNKLPFICDVKAITPVKLIRLEDVYFEKWIRESNDVSIYLLKSLCETSYNLSKKAIVDTLYSLKFRICDYIINEYEKLRLKKYKKIYLRKELLSENFVVTRRSINRILKELHDNGYIYVMRDKIEILLIDKLIMERERERF